MRWSLIPRSAKSQGKGKRVSRRHGLDRWRFPLVIELLEERTLLSTIQWINPAGGDWGVAANWDFNRVPQASDDVVINVGAAAAWSLRTPPAATPSTASTASAI
jgi:hypothetical protein